MRTKSINEQVAEAWVNYGKRNFLVAKEVFRDCASAEAFKQEALEGYYLCCMELGLPDRAVELYEIYQTELSEKNRSFYAMALEELERKKQSHLIALNSLIADAWNTFKQKEFETSLSSFEKAVPSQEVRQEALEGYYLCCMELDRPEKVVELFGVYRAELTEKNQSFLAIAIEELERQKQSHLIALNSLIAEAWKSYKEKEFETSLSSFEKAVSSQEVRQEALEGYYLCCMELGFPDRAVELYQTYQTELSDKNRSLYAFAVEELERQKHSHFTILNELLGKAWEDYKSENYSIANIKFKECLDAEYNIKEALEGLFLCSVELKDFNLADQELQKRLSSLSEEDVNFLSALKIKRSQQDCLEETEEERIDRELEEFSEKLEIRFNKKDWKELFSFYQLNNKYNKALQELRVEFSDRDIKDALEFFGLEKFIKLYKKSSTPRAFAHFCYVIQDSHLDHIFEALEPPDFANKYLRLVLITALKKMRSYREAVDFVLQKEIHTRNDLDDEFIKEFEAILIKVEKEAQAEKILALFNSEVIYSDLFNLEAIIENLAEYFNGLNDAGLERFYKIVVELLDKSRDNLELSSFEKQVDRLCFKIKELSKVSFSELPHQQRFPYSFINLLIRQKKYSLSQSLLHRVPSDWDWKSEHSESVQVLSSQIEVKEITIGENSYDFAIMWSLHNRCNYHCSYCPPILNQGDISWMRLKKIKTFIDKIHNHYVKRLGKKNIIFSFTGGEPTLWKDFKPFLKYIQSYGIKVGLTTNASVSPKFWKDIGENFDYICFSFHPESADIEKFINNFKAFHDNPVFVVPSVRIMMHPSDRLWQRSEEVFNEIKKFDNWTIQCVHILDDYGNNPYKIKYDSDYKNEFLRKNNFVSQFNDSNLIPQDRLDFRYIAKFSNDEVRNLNENQIINDDMANFYGMSCNIGIDHLFIHHSGDIQLAGCGIGGTVGNIMDFDVENLPSKPTRCTRFSCLCPTDIRITKRYESKALLQE